MSYKNSNLPKEHIFQKGDDDCCGPCCLSIVYKIKGKKISLSRIVKDLNLEKKCEPTYSPQLARHLNKNGLITKLIIANFGAISPAWAKENNKKIIENLKDWVVIQPDHNFHLFGLHSLFYLQEGGKIELRPCFLEDLKRMLDNGSILILCVDEVWLWGHRLLSHKSQIDEIRGKTLGHFIVVKGYKGDKFSVLDPYPTKIPERHGSYTVDGKDLLNSSLIWSATIIEVLK